MMLLREVNAGIKERRAQEGAWGPGYRSARAFRKVIGVQEGDCLKSVSGMARMLGNGEFASVEGLFGVNALVSRRDCVYVHLRQSPHVTRPAENFSFARAIGDVVCFPGGGPSVVNRLHGTERQAMGGAFAAEFLAPTETVSDMVLGGWDVDEIADVLAVYPRVVEHQIENRERIRQACS